MSTSSNAKGLIMMVKLPNACKSTCSVTNFHAVSQTLEGMTANIPLSIPCCQIPQCGISPVFPTYSTPISPCSTLFALLFKSPIVVLGTN